MNYYLTGYQDAMGGFFDERYAKNTEYVRGWDACFKDYTA